MRTLNKNKQKMYYALFDKKVPIYETDENGEILYDEVDGERIPIETGETKLGYGEAKKLLGNIAMSGGESEAREFGLSVEDYNAIVLCGINEFPIKEGTLIWHESQVGYEDVDKTIVDSDTADYIVIKAHKSINQVKYILKAKVK